MENTQSSGQQSIVRQVRLAHDMTQQEFADKLGCALVTVKKLEGESRLPANKGVLRNLKALGTLAGIEIETQGTGGNNS
jgi:transcriptional regulator with XRE-family HTH domain